MQLTFVWCGNSLVSLPTFVVIYTCGSQDVRCLTIVVLVIWSRLEHAVLLFEGVHSQYLVGNLLVAVVAIYSTHKGSTVRQLLTVLS